MDRLGAWMRSSGHGFNGEISGLEDLRLVEGVWTMK
jgi:hypothetical protein